MLSIATALLVAVSVFAAPVESNPVARAAQPAQEGERPRPPGGPESRGAERRISVEGAMKIMNRNMKQLKTQVSDPAKKEENLGFINEMQRGCVTAKGLPLPKDVLERAGDEPAQTKMKQEFRSEMLSLLKSLIALEEAVDSGKTDVATTLLDEIQAQRERTHKQMGVKDED